jgi:uncharacterized integral membrane protein
LIGPGSQTWAERANRREKMLLAWAPANGPALFGIVGSVLVGAFMMVGAELAR